MNPPATLNEADLIESFARSSGPGGQNVNKVSTRVTLRHIPTGITITVQDSRSQSQNRELARERMLAALRNRQQKAEDARRHARELARRKNAPRPTGIKRRMVESKRHRARVKTERRRTED